MSVGRRSNAAGGGRFRAGLQNLEDEGFDTLPGRRHGAPCPKIECRLVGPSAERFDAAACSRSGVLRVWAIYPATLSKEFENE
jgi:hypothetical protein